MNAIEKGKMMNQEMYWYNFRKQEYEYIPTPTDFRDYIPQQQAAQALYQLYLQGGDAPIIATRKILEISTGK